MKQKSPNFKTIILSTGLFFSCITLTAQTQIGTDINGETAADYSGYSISSSSDGNTVAIGGPDNDGSGSNAGHVRVYKNITGTWTQIGSDINGEAADDESGYSVSLSADGSTVAIGAPGNDGSGTNAGHVRVYKNIAGTWTQIGADINGELAQNLSGSSVSISADGSIVAIGAPNNYGNAAKAGHVRVYKNTAGTWTQIGADINGEAADNYSGSSVSLSADGSTVAIGAPYNDTYIELTSFNNGQVRVYKNIAGTWSKIGADIDGNGGDFSGSSISLSDDGSTVAIGAPGNDDIRTDSGRVRIYKNISGSWSKIGADIYGEKIYDQCGSSVSLSADGKIVAIGSFSYDYNGFEVGYVRVFQNTTGSWNQLGNNIYGEAEYDLSGGDVCLSSDGKILAIGARGNDGSGNNAGHVRVFDLSAILSTDSFVLENSKIYPNPVKNELHIDLEQGLTLQEVNIYSTLGQFIKKEKTNTINVSSLSRGFYFVQIVTEKGKATHKILVE